MMRFASLRSRRTSFDSSLVKMRTARCFNRVVHSLVLAQPKAFSFSPDRDFSRTSFRALGAELLT